VTAVTINLALVANRLLGQATDIIDQKSTTKVIPIPSKALKLIFVIVPALLEEPDGPVVWLEAAEPDTVAVADNDARGRELLVDVREAEETRLSEEMPVETVAEADDAVAVANSCADEYVLQLEDAGIRGCHGSTVLGDKDSGSDQVKVFPAEV